MSKGNRRVFAVGLDGLDPRILEPMLRAGDLPNLARLAERGGYARVRTTTPAQTPVAWSTFATGVNPGGHGIFDFLTRDPSTYLPDLALNRYERKSALLPPRAVNLRRGTPVWDILSRAGIESTILRCPCTYPPDEFRGRMLSGMGVPDLRGGFGTATYYTTESGVSHGESEQVGPLSIDDSGIVHGHLIGPRSAGKDGDLLARFSVRFDHDGRGSLSVDGAGSAVSIATGEWSDWLEVVFSAGMFRKVRGLVRFLLLRRSPDIALYASPVNMSPDAPMFPISTPPEYARELSSELGLYYTTGMVEDHAGLSNGRFDEQAFLSQCEIAWRERESMLRHELDHVDAGFVYCLFDTPDRVQHMLWRFLEPEHPANGGRPVSDELARSVGDVYRRSDRIVGEVLEAANDRDLVIALSDHGFGTFRRGINLNSWLLEQGYLALREGCDPGPTSGDLLRAVDWERTRAYSVGLSGLYLNLRGREARGIVPPEVSDTLRDEIASRLATLVDPATGDRAIRRALRREEAYHGPYVEEAPDVLALCGAGYRLSWSSSMGGVSDGIFEDNTRKWSGDHIVDPDLVPGVLFMNRPFDGSNARLLDLAPSILSALGVPRGPAMEGNSLLD